MTRRASAWRGAALAFTFILASCQGGQDERARPGTILIVGDSLTAGYGLTHPDEQAWPALIARQWRAQGFLAQEQQVINAGISGDTTAGGLTRLPGLLDEHHPGTVVIALGSNDVRRQSGVGAMERNLSEMTRLAQEAGAKVLLVGVDLPTPLAMAARGQPNRSIHKVSEQRGVDMATIPLDEIFEDGNMLPDQVHPARGGQATIQESLEPALRKVAGP